MNSEQFSKLDFRTQKSLIISMHVRNEMEDFHVENLSDKQMKELNPIIRQAIYDALTIWDMSGRSFDDRFNTKNKKEWQESLAFSIMCVPDYWEMPDKNKIKKKVGDMAKRKI